MKFLLIIIFLVLCSCKQQTGNSHSSDENVNNAIETINNSNNSTDEQLVNESGETVFNSAAVQAVLDSKCISCHRHSSWPTNDQDWINNSRIDTSDPTNSSLIQRMSNCGTGGSANMPPSYAADPSSVTNEQCDLIIKWIEHLYELETEALRGN